MDRAACITSHFTGCLIGVLLLLSNAVYSADNRIALVIGNANDGKQESEPNRTGVAEQPVRLG